MSWTLDAAINDWSISVMASTLADRARSAGAAADVERYEAEAEWFARRSLLYRTVFDRDRGFFIGRTADGQWRVGDDFDPADWGDDYTETNAWGTMFTVPHDGAGLVELHGGEAGFVSAIERFFATRETGNSSHSGSYGFAIHEMTEARDIRMGMLGLSNQPAHHIPFFPMFAGRHDEAHRIVRECLERLFVGSDLGQGYPGDEDNGELSAWYIFATIGLYPLAPATGSYVLVPPSVSRTELRQPDAAVTVIERMPGSTGPYVESVSVDGEPWESISIPHKLVASGVHIAFTLSDTPTGWAAASRPVSASDLHGYLDPPNDILPIGGSPLTDDTGAHVVAMAAGETLEFSTVDAIASLYTVTVASAGAYSWTVRLGQPDQVGTAQHRVDEVFEWAGQTRVFRIPRPIGNRACTVFQFTADSPVH
jgi:predicted alpha-1,2-mannosidase